MMRRALFLDRDGVINVDHGYVHRPEEFQFIDGIFDVVSAANHAGFFVVVVTNQSGIGRGYYSEQDFLELMDWMKERFVANGAQIDAIYHCPYHPEHGLGQYKRESSCRKPAPGMFLRAEQEHGIMMRQSILIGDKLSDVSAGKAAGVGTILHFSSDARPDGCLVISRLPDAVPFLTSPPR